MPSIYTHEVFGKTVLAMLPASVRFAAEEYPRPFQIGLQGPDLLFFYRPYYPNIINRTGINMHSQPVLHFLIPATRMIYAKGKDSPEYSYYLGFILHFLLDSKCHPYINSMVKSMSFNHIEMETEFDRFLLTQRGHEALAYPSYRLIPTDLATAAAIAPLYRSYPGITTTAVLHALKDMRFYKHLFFAPTPRRRRSLEHFFKACGLYPLTQGHLMHTAVNPKSAITNPCLLRMLKEELPCAAALLTSIDNILKQEETEAVAELMKLPRLQYNFKGEMA